MKRIVVFIMAVVVMSLPISAVAATANQHDFNGNYVYAKMHNVTKYCPYGSPSDYTVYQKSFNGNVVTDTIIRLTATSIVSAAMTAATEGLAYPVATCQGLFNQNHFFFRPIFSAIPSA